MAGKDIIMVRQKDLKRLHVIHKVIEGELTQVRAAEIMSLRERQVWHIVKSICEEGDGGIQHRLRGREPNNKLPQKACGATCRAMGQGLRGRSIHDFH